MTETAIPENDEKHEKHELANPPVSPAKRREEALEAARVSALRLANSVLANSGVTCLLYYDDEEAPHPTLDPAPKMFLTPTEEKSLREKRQVETLQRTVVAKKAWLRVSELKRERGELDRVLKALQGNPSILVGTQLEHKMKSLVRLKDADLDVAVHAAQLAESELQRAKMTEHEERVGTLQHKIAAVEGLKKEQSSRRKKAAAKAEEDKARAQRQPSQAEKQSRVDAEGGETKESGGEGSGGGAGDALSLVEKVDGAPPPSSSLSSVVPSPQPAVGAGAARGYPVRYFANCFQGLSTMYCKALLERPGWRPYPSEEWFVTEQTKLTIWSPLAKSAVDFCDTASFSTGVHALLWEGADHFEDKAKLADLLDGLHVPHHPQGALMPPTFVVPAAPKEGDGGKEGAEVWDGVVTEAMVRCAPAEGAKAWCERVREKGGVHKFFAKDSGRNFCTGIHVCRDLAAVKRAVEGGGGKEAFVVQEAVRSLELSGYRISCRAYVAVVSPAFSREARFFVYTEGWLSNAPKPAHEANANAAPSPTEAEAANAGAEGKAAPEQEDEAEYEGERNATNERYLLFSEWDRYGEVFPRCEAYLELMCGRLAPKLTLKEELPSFELFGVDFILGALPGRPGEGCSSSGCDGEADRLWVCEVNRSPRQTETELPMLHALLDLVFDEKQSPPEAIEKRGAHFWKPITPLVPTPPPPPGA